MNVLANMVEGTHKINMCIILVNFKIEFNLFIINQDQEVVKKLAHPATYGIRPDGASCYVWDPPGWLSGENVGLMTCWLLVRYPVET